MVNVGPGGVVEKANLSFYVAHGPDYPLSYVKKDICL